MYIMNAQRLENVQRGHLVLVFVLQLTINHSYIEGIYHATTKSSLNPAVLGTGVCVCAHRLAYVCTDLPT